MQVQLTDLNHFKLLRWLHGAPTITKYIGLGQGRYL